MAPLTPTQATRVARTEALIRLMEPFLNALLAAGERISRIAEPRDLDYVPARPLEGDESLRAIAQRSKAPQ